MYFLSVSPKKFKLAANTVNTRLDIYQSKSKKQQLKLKEHKEVQIG